MCCSAHLCTWLPRTSLADRDAIASAVPISAPSAVPRSAHPSDRTASSQPSAPARCPARSVCSEAIFSALCISEKAPEIASCQTGRVGFRAEPERQFDADRVGWVGRLAVPAVGRGFGCACRGVTVVCPGRLSAARTALLRMCGFGSRSVVHVHALRPAAFAGRFSGSMSVGPAASASICMCGADVGLACRWLARAMQCLRSICANAYCMCP